MFRIILVALFAATPLIANAQAADALLGPSSTSNGQSTSGSGNQSSNLLQPASKSDGDSLQSTGTSGVTQSTDQSALQRPASADEAKLFISGDMDTEDEASDGNGFLAVAIACALTLGLVVLIVYIFRNKLRLPQITAYEQGQVRQDAEPIIEPKEEPPASKPKATKRKKKSSKKKSPRRKSK